jgi:hypothetical protein
MPAIVELWGFHSYVVRGISRIDPSTDRMNLRTSLKKSRLRPLWQYTTKGVLWQIQAGSGRVVLGEDRNLETKEVSFFCLDRRTGAPLWYDLRLEELWWCGIEAIHDSCVVFHGFASPDMPGHRGVTVADFRSGKILWRNPQVRYVSGSETSLKVVRESREMAEALELNLLTGDVIQQTGADRSIPGVHSGLTEARMDVRVPEVFSPELSPHEQLLQHLGDPGTLTPPVQILEVGGLIVLAIQARNPGSSNGQSPVQARLYVLGGSDRHVLFEDTLTRSARAPTAQSFFVQLDVLYYVKERSTLVALPLMMTP